ncbi:MAG TPA: MoxR family ATPase [Kofleriaceae bacterium]|jgi:MoxR-like ATPase|nr:MoxR family ATPase [Kofleriaceae bacterium]
MIDTRDARRAIASLLLAAGTPPADELELAADRLRALGWPPLGDGDWVRETPESLAPRIPRALYADVLTLLYELAGDEPIRRRIADAYAGLWRAAPAASTAAPRRGAALTRWLIGPLPHHQVGGISEENAMNERGTPYRGGELAAPAAERTPLRRRVERIQGEFHRVIAAVEQVIVGKRDVIERVLIAMAARGHVLLVDAPGVGKTQLCKAIACAIATRFGRIQFTPDLLPMDITGANVFDVRNQQFVFRPGPIFTHILLADEINRATPKTQSALLEVMEERSVTVDGTTHGVEEPFSVLATMNPLDHQGTYALPAAQIDRFMMMLEIGYPTPDDEVRVLDTHLGATPPLAAVQPVISRASFIEWRDTVPHIHVSPEIKRTAVDYIHGLRRISEAGPSISPRATLAWVRAGQARAMLSGREFVTAEDIMAIAPDVLRHRMWTDGATVRERLRAIAMAGTHAAHPPHPAHAGHAAQGARR